MFYARKKLHFGAQRNYFPNKYKLCGEGLFKLAETEKEMKETFSLLLEGLKLKAN